MLQQSLWEKYCALGTPLGGLTKDYEKKLFVVLFWLNQKKQ